jgi:hypothetical protein
MTRRLEHDRASREFGPVDSPSLVVRPVQKLVQPRREIREAHPVGMRLSGSGRVTPTLVLVSDDPSINTTVAEDLRRALQHHVRPGIAVLARVDDELIRVRGRGGELKRGEERLPWWVLLLGG